MRGRGRPARRRRSIFVGQVNVASVRGPVMNVTVPSAIRPANRSIWGPSAPTRTGQGSAPGHVEFAHSRHHLALVGDATVSHQRNQHR